MSKTFETFLGALYICHCTNTSHLPQDCPKNAFCVYCSRHGHYSRFCHYPHTFCVHYQTCCIPLSHQFVGKKCAWLSRHEEDVWQGEDYGWMDFDAYSGEC